MAKDRNTSFRNGDVHNQGHNSHSHCAFQLASPKWVHNHKAGFLLHGGEVVVFALSYQWLTTGRCILNSRLKLKKCLYPQSRPNTVWYGTKCSAFNHHTRNFAHSPGSRMAEYGAFIAHSETTTTSLLFCSRWQNTFMDHHNTATSSATGPRLNIKTVLSTYGDFHVKDKTAVRTSYL